NPSFNLYSSNPASNIELENGDYDSLGSDGFCDTTIDYNSFSVIGYNDFALNSTGKAAISKISVSKFGLRIVNDATDSPPGWSGEYYGDEFQVYQAEQGSGFKPKLVVTFTPVTAPTVTTQAVDDIDTETATGHGNITDNGGEDCSKRGVCWNTTGNPTVADSKSEETDSFGVGAFTRPMTGLTPEQHYYVKAYAYNSAGDGYGGQVEFDTPPAYTVHEVEVSDGIALTDTLVKTPMLFKSDGLALSDVLVKTPIKTLVDGIAFKDILVKLIDKR
ncbi:unnamed protein product, partial [marine sediment metagenome]